MKANERLWQRSSIVSPVIHLIDDRTLSVELRRIDKQSFGKRSRITAEGSFNEATWYTLPTLTPLVLSPNCTGFVVTFDVRAILHLRLRSRPRPLDDLLLRFVSE